MKALITGSKGYVGSVLVPYLLEKKILVKQVDACWFSERNTLQPTIDVRDALNSEFFENIDAVVYLSAISNDPIGKQFEYLTQDINADACMRFAQKAKSNGVRHFVFASSCSMYGAATDIPRKETDPLNPLTAYAKSKARAEEKLQQLADETFQVTALRFSTACGASPNLRLDLVLNDFVASAVLNKKIEVLSDGSPWRPLIHVLDMARSIHWALTRKTGASFLAVNIGSDAWTFQVRDIAQKVQECIPGTDLSINACASADKRSYKVDFSLFQKIAPNYQPQVSMEEAITVLANQLKELVLGENVNFRDAIPYIRLRALNQHLESGKMNADLRWTKS